MAHEVTSSGIRTDNTTAVARALTPDIVAKLCSGRTNPRHGDRSIDRDAIVAAA
jgi:hypothetical protein